MLNQFDPAGRNSTIRFSAWLSRFPQLWTPVFPFHVSSEGWNGKERMPVTTEMSESSSIHSAKLVSLARSLSGLGLDAANGGPINPPDDEPPPPVWSPLDPNHMHTEICLVCMRFTLYYSHEFAACNPHHSFIHSFIHSLGVRHRSRPWAVFLWRQEESGLHPLLQIQEKAVVQATPFHHIQWEYTITDTGPMGNGSRVCGSRSTCWRGGGAEAVRGGEGFNEGGVWGRSPGGWTTDRAWQRGVYSALTLNFLAFPVRCKRYYWVRAVLKWFDLKSCDWTSSKQVKDKTQSVLWTWRTCLRCN